MFPDSLEEIGDHSISGFRFPRRTFQDRLGSCVSSRGEIVGSSSVYSNLFEFLDERIVQVKMNLDR
jgi:hypothetical protein